MRKFIFSLITTSLLIFGNSCSSDSETQEVPDTIAPVVSLSIVGLANEVAGEPIVVSNQIEVRVDAKDEGGISKVEAFINDEKVGEDITAPYSIIIDVSSYDSKIGKTENYKDYILKVVATDNAGNTASAEKEIYIDNETPSITEVSLEGGVVLNGDNNAVTFTVADNEELYSVIVYLNDELLSDIVNEIYEVNIDTSTLSDGENILRIEAKDQAGNLGSHTVSFFADNTGPDITLQSIVEGQILDEPISLEPQVSDEYSDVESLEILYGETSLELFDSSTSSYQLDFDPDQHQVGDGAIILVAKDNLGNSNQITFNIKILRLLLKIAIPEGYLSPNIPTNHFVFASKMDGSVIDQKEIIFETREVKLHAFEEFENDKDFTITFASLGSNGVSSYLYSIANLNRQHPKQLNLKLPKRFRGDSATYYPINGFSDTTQLFCFGRGYYFSSSAEGDTLIQTFVPSNHSLQSDVIYIYGFNPLNNFYNYQFVNQPIASDFEMDFDNFSTQNIQGRQFSTTPVEFLNNNSKFLTVYGFQNQLEVDNDLFHQIWQYGYDENVNVSGSFNFNLNTQFFEYAHDVVIGNYQSKGLGLPQENIIIPNWSIDYTFQNNKFSLLKSGTGHVIGEIFLEGGYDVSSPYQWNLVFDSNKNQEIVLPEIPEEFQNFSFYSQYRNADLAPKKVGLQRYDNVNDYKDYLESIVKMNKAFGRSAPRSEGIYTGEARLNFSNSDYFYNWW